MTEFPFIHILTKLHSTAADYYSWWLNWRIQVCRWCYVPSHTAWYSYCLV